MAAAFLAPSALKHHLRLLRPDVDHAQDVRLTPAADGFESVAGAQWGAVDRVALSQGGELLALAHSTSKLSLVALPSPPCAVPARHFDAGADAAAPGAPSLEIVRELKTTSTLKAANKTVALEFVDGGLLHATSAGHLSLHALPSASDSSAPLKRRLPANLTCLSSLGADGKSFAYAGHEVDLSVWDTERAFACAAAAETPAGGAKESGKRKKGVQLLEGETWRAQNLPNDHLQLRVPIHHLSLSPSPRSPTSKLYTGTYSGHVRLYDPRASRRPVANHHVLSGAQGKVGVGALAASEDGGVWFAEDGRGQGRVGRMDDRTGRVLYYHSDSSATATALLPSNDGKSIAVLSADQTLAAYTAPKLPADAKQTPQKGALLARTGGVAGRAAVALSDALGAYLAPTPDRATGAEGADGKGEDDDDDDDDVEGVWSALPELKDGERAASLASDSDDDADVVVESVEAGAGAEEESDWGSSSEEEVQRKRPAKKRAVAGKGKGAAAGAGGKKGGKGRRP